MGARGAAADRRAPQLGPAFVEEIVDEALVDVVDLALGERPEREVLNPSRQCVGDGGQRQDVGGAREQELAAGLVGIEASLDRQQQLGYALDLIDRDRHVDVGDEPGPERDALGI